MPAFCKACGTIGHVSADYRTLNLALEGGQNEQPVQGVQKNPIEVEEDRSKDGSDRGSQIHVEESPASPLASGMVVSGKEIWEVSEREHRQDEIPRRRYQKFQRQPAGYTRESQGRGATGRVPRSPRAVGEVLAVEPNIGQKGIQSGSQSMSSRGIETGFGIFTENWPSQISLQSLSLEVRETQVGWTVQTRAQAQVLRLDLKNRH